MRSFAVPVVIIALGAVAATAASPQTQPAPAAGTTDVYHVHFAKAVPGQAAALGKALMVPDQTAPMPDHFVVLRHNEGDDWDYASIQHLGPKAAVTPVPAPAADPPRSLTAWHEDTFVAGPAWAEFTKQMGIGSGNAAAMVYTLGVHRPVPGHREQLLKSLSAPASATSKIQTGTLLFQHIEGGAWTFLTLTRHNSWQDFATDRAATDPAAAGGWDDIRQHSGFHRDTIASRIFPAK